MLPPPTHPRGSISPTTTSLEHLGLQAVTSEEQEAEARAPSQRGSGQLEAI